MLCTHCHKAQAGQKSRYATARMCGRCWWAVHVGPERVRSCRDEGDAQGRQWADVRGVEVENNTSGKKLPAQPTRALPGSAEKIRVLGERAAAGQLLYHPLDAGMGKWGDEEDGGLVLEEGFVPLSLVDRHGGSKRIRGRVAGKVADGEE